MRDQNQQLIQLLTPGEREIRQALEQTSRVPSRDQMCWDELLDPIAGALSQPHHSKTLASTAAEPLIVYPGLARDSLAMRPVMRLCRRMGYDARDWGRGINMGPSANVDEFIAGLCAEVQEAAFRANRPVTLLGWSLGGVYAREIARLVPEAVRHIVAIGSPAHYAGDAFGVRWLLRWAARTGHVDVRALLARLRRPLTAPFTCLSALADGRIERLPALA